MDGAREVAFPEFVSTISICIVFLPIFLLQRHSSSYVFRPAGAGVVVSAMIRPVYPAGPHAGADAGVDHLLPRRCRHGGRKHAGGVLPPRGLHFIHHAIEGGMDRSSPRPHPVAASLSLLHALQMGLVLLPPLLAIASAHRCCMKSRPRVFLPPKTDAGLDTACSVPRIPSAASASTTPRRSWPTSSEKIRELIPARGPQHVHRREHRHAQFRQPMAWGSIPPAPSAPPTGKSSVQLGAGPCAQRRNTS